MTSERVYFPLGCDSGSLCIWMICFVEITIFFSMSTCRFEMFSESFCKCFWSKMIALGHLRFGSTKVRAVVKKKIVQRHNDISLCFVLCLAKGTVRSFSCLTCFGVRFFVVILDWCRCLVCGVLIQGSLAQGSSKYLFDTFIW